MGTYPTTPRTKFLDWCITHRPIFTANAAAIGLTPAEATAFSDAVDEAQTTNEARMSAAEAAKAATMVNDEAFSNLRTITRSTVGSIKAFAIGTNNPSVYSTAQIPAPAAPTPMPPPGIPTDLVVGLVPTTGQIELRWKATNPTGATGTAYIIRRRTGGSTAPFEFVGVTGEKRFVDSTFSAGPDRVEYTIQGQRSDSAGPVSNILVINFGIPGAGGGGGGFTFSTTEATGDAANPKPVKMAA